MQHAASPAITPLSLQPRTLAIAFGLPVALALFLSAFGPADLTTWFLEVAPVVIAAPLLAFSWKRYPLTTLLYALIALHCLVLILGGAYTYAQVPLGFWLQDLLGLERNPYDRIGHLMQGLVPTMIAREILVRGRHVQGRGMLAFVCVCIALAISAAYELVEWGAALILGQGADEFLGTQGDPWDTQSDMFCALLGSIAALGLLSRTHDRQIAALEAARPA